MAHREKMKLAQLREQTGFSLIEVLVAVGILAFISVAFLTALNTTSRSAGTYEQHVIAASLARSQVERIKAMAYDADGNYPVEVTLPQGYSMSISAVLMPTGAQEITVRVSQGGRGVFALIAAKTSGG